MKKIVGVIVVAIGFSSVSHAALITFDFEGVINGTNDLFNEGDTFSGSYTYESAVEPLPSIGSDVQARVISPDLAGTSWNLDVFSSAVDDFSLAGSFGSLSLQNDRALFGDRYIATLSV